MRARTTSARVAEISVSATSEAQVRRVAAAAMARPKRTAWPTLPKSTWARLVTSSRRMTGAGRAPRTARAMIVQWRTGVGLICGRDELCGVARAFGEAAWLAAQYSIAHCGHIAGFVDTPFCAAIHSVPRGDHAPERPPQRLQEGVAGRHLRPLRGARPGAGLPVRGVRRARGRPGVRARRPGGLGLRGEAGLSGGVPVYAGRPADDVSRPAVDDAAVRRLRRRGGVQPALPLPAGARPDRPLRGVRPADADRIRLRPPDGAGRGGEGWRGYLLSGGHGAPVQGDTAGEGHDLDDDKRYGRHPPRLLRGDGEKAGRRPDENGRYDPA